MQREARVHLYPDRSMGLSLRVILAGAGFFILGIANLEVCSFL
jgi:hypothetical protein